MRHGFFGLAVLAVMMVATGCVAATTVKNNRFVTTTRELVAVNDQVYVVDKNTGEVMIIDMTSARPFEPESLEE